MHYKQVNRFLPSADAKRRCVYTGCKGKAVWTMAKEQVSFKNRDRFIQLGIAISSLRKLRGMSQEQLAEKANISRSHLSAIEAPGMVRAMSMEAFYNIADALEIEPAELINASMFPERILKKKPSL